MKTVHAPASFCGRPARLAGLFVVLVLAFHCPQAFAVEVIPIGQYKKAIDPNITITNDKIEFFGLQITERGEEIAVFYNRRKITNIFTSRILNKKIYTKSAYVACNYPQQGMTTLFVPIFTGGANCCSVDLVVTKTDNCLSINTVHAGSGMEISADDIKKNEGPYVSNDCIRNISFENVDPEMFGWCTASAPRPAACLVFENDAWRFARPAEKPDQYEYFLREEMNEFSKQNGKSNNGEEYDRQILYSDAASIVFHSIMAGKSDMESSNLLKKVIPGLDEQHRKNFISNIKKEIDACQTIENKKIPFSQAGTTNNPPAKGSLVPPGSAASGSFQTTPCGSITDAKNRLEWFVGPDETVTFAQAKAWVKALTTCGTGWELPTIAQLASLFDPRSTAGTGYVLAGKHWPAHMNPLFSGIGRGSWVWSREEINANVAKSYNFNQGSETRTDKDNKTMTIRVFAVRKI